MAKNPTQAPAGTPSKIPTIGQRLIAALVPRHFKTLSALHMAAQGPAYSTLNNWKNGTAIPDWSSICHLYTSDAADASQSHNHPRLHII